MYIKSLRKFIPFGMRDPRCKIQNPFLLYGVCHQSPPLRGLWTYSMAYTCILSTLPPCLKEKCLEAPDCCVWTLRISAVCAAILVFTLRIVHIHNIVTVTIHKWIDVRFRTITKNWKHFCLVYQLTQVTPVACFFFPVKKALSMFFVWDYWSRG